MKLLADDEIQARLAGLEGWTRAPQAIQKRYRLDSFPSVMNFVNRVADLAEGAAHHPDILIQYDSVTFTLTTHDAGGVTEKDLVLAERIEAIAP